MLLPVLLLLLTCHGCGAYRPCASNLHRGFHIHSNRRSLTLRTRRAEDPVYGYTALKAATLDLNADGSAAISKESKCPIMRFTNWLKVVWSFTRPHTIMGSGLSVLFLYAFATPVGYWSKGPFWNSLFSSLFAALLMNVYITGLNQCTDIDIDKINKPYLPIAAGKMSKETGIAIVVTSLLSSLYLARNREWPLQMVLLGSGALGTVYSLEPFRLKRFPLLAALCILTVRGSLVNFGFFFQAKMQIMGTPLLSLSSAIRAFPEILLVSVFFALFGVVIAVMKDAPDVEGDLIYKIPSFSVQLGAGKMFRFAWKLLFGLLTCSSTACIYLLGKDYGAIGVGRRLGRLGLGGILAAIALDAKRRAVTIRGSDSKKIFDYYMYTWNVFYACYALLPLLGIAFV